MLIDTKDLDPKIITVRGQEVELFVEKRYLDGIEVLKEIDLEVLFECF